MNRASFKVASDKALRSGDFRGLVSLCQAMRRTDPSFADAWFLESVAAEAGRNIGAALKLVTQALKLDPGNGEYLVQKARYHSVVGQMDAAAGAVAAALKTGISSPPQLNTLGVVSTRLGDHKTAATLLRKAAESAPKNAEYAFNLAAAEQFLGREHEARQLYERVLALQPTNARSYWALSELDKVSVNTRHEKVMRELINRPGLNERDGLYLAHALARIDESRGDYAAALQGLTTAKARRRKSLNYHFDHDASLFHAIRSHFAEPEDVCARRSAASSSTERPAPVFIVGLPRTGTTLVEQILTAHSAVESLGELQDLSIALKRLSGDAGNAVLSPAVIAATSTGEVDLEDEYLRTVAPRLRTLDSGTQFFVDKTPLNALLLGHVMRHMPKARVILLRRNPMDATLSNYRQLFSLEYSYYNYNYDLEDAARYVAAFEGLAAHWEALLGERLLLIDYEALVAEPEIHIRSLLDHLDLEWEEQCLHFHANTRAVATPSAGQVRQPMFSSAIGRWRRYGAALDPVRAIFEEQGITRGLE